MSKHDMRARPIHHHKRESIQAHLAIVFAALAVTRLVEERTGWSIKRFVRTTRTYRTVQIQAGHQLLTAEDPLPPRPTRRARRHPTTRCAPNCAKLGIGLNVGIEHSAS